MEFTSDHSNYDRCELNSRNKMKNLKLTKSKLTNFLKKYALIPRQWRRLTRRDREVVDFTRSRVKNNTELTNFIKLSRIEGYNGKYGSNPQ